MFPAEDGSVTRCLDDLKAEDHGAARVLWGRYFERLVRLARRRLLRSHAVGAEEDEEDAALSAFDNFCAGLAGGRFPELSGRDELWRLQVTITARKAAAQADRRRSLKRGGGRVAIAIGPDDSDPGAGGRALADLAGREPDPGFAALAAEEFRRLLDRLGDGEVRQIALWRMEGFTADEIAGRLGCARRTVARRLDLIRQIWSAEG